MNPQVNYIKQILKQVLKVVKYILGKITGIINWFDIIVTRAIYMIDGMLKLSTAGGVPSQLKIMVDGENKITLIKTSPIYMSPITPTLERNNIRDIKTRLLNKPDMVKILSDMQYVKDTMYMPSVTNFRCKANNYKLVMQDVIINEIIIEKKIAIVIDLLTAKILNKIVEKWIINQNLYVTEMDDLDEQDIYRTCNLIFMSIMTRTIFLTRCNKFAHYINADEANIVIIANSDLDSIPCTITLSGKRYESLMTNINYEQCIRYTVLTSDKCDRNEIIENIKTTSLYRYFEIVYINGPMQNETI